VRCRAATVVRLAAREPVGRCIGDSDEKRIRFFEIPKEPLPKQLKRQVTIRLDTAAVDYFKKMAAELGMPYQNLINLFLRDCAIQKRRPVIQWPPEKP
jgi:predicted DNA binding CopG/RHH family protein